MIEQILIEFINFLNKNDFNVNISKIFHFMDMLNNEDISFANYEDVVGIMRISFCTNKYESDNIGILFKKFLKDYKAIKKIYNKIEKNENNILELTKEKQNSEIDLDKLVENSKEKKEKIEEEFKEKRKQLEKENNGIISIETIITKREFDFLNKNKTSLKRIKLSKEIKQINKEILEDKLEKAAKKDIDKLLNEVMNYAKKCILNNDVETFNLSNKYFCILEKVLKFKSSNELVIEQKLCELEHLKNKEKRKVDEEIEKERRNNEKIQEKIKFLLSSNENLKSKVITKEEAINHREEFVNGKNSVKTRKENEDIIFEKKFKQLDLKDKESIKHYINKNILKFKTKLSKNIRTNEKQNIDVAETVKNACKTRGLPINIIYEKPKASKPNMVLILDVSGSCKEASEMMLTFMYLLQDVFKGGCKTFAFVDTLFDISNIMKSNNIEESIKRVLNTIPRKGVYSNYYKPLKTLWCDKNKCINKDSIVIFIGDARNNSNPDGIRYLRNICRKAKKSYWLNTEKSSKWGKQDSLAFKYNKIIKMYETLNVGDLIYFLNNF